MGRYKDCCIVSVAFREPYVSHSHIQGGYLRAFEPDLSFTAFRDQLPINYGGIVIGDAIVPTFQKSLYGFKPHAITKKMNDGNNYKKVIWFDPSVLPISSVKILFDSLDTHPMIVRTGEHELSKMCNEKAKKWFGVTDEDIKGVKHIGGTIYGFNFNNDKVKEVFELWKKAEEEGIFQDQDAFMKGNNWADESAMALSMYKVGVDQYWENKFSYINQKDL